MVHNSDTITGRQSYPLSSRHPWHRAHSVVGGSVYRRENPRHARTTRPLTCILTSWAMISLFAGCQGPSQLEQISPPSFSDVADACPWLTVETIDDAISDITVLRNDGNSQSAVLSGAFANCRLNCFRTDLPPCFTFGDENQDPICTGSGLDQECALACEDCFREIVAYVYR
jgi:hypothetical protein